MTKLVSALTLAVFAAVGFNAQAASHTGGAPMDKASGSMSKASGSMSKASGPMGKASGSMMKKDEMKKDEMKK